MPEGSRRIDQKARDGIEFRARKFQQYQKHDEGIALVLGTCRSRIQGSMQQQHRDVRGEIRSEQTLASRNALQSAHRGMYLYGTVIRE